MEEANPSRQTKDPLSIIEEERNPSCVDIAYEVTSIDQSNSPADHMSDSKFDQHDEDSHQPQCGISNDEDNSLPMDPLLSSSIQKIGTDFWEENELLSKPQPAPKSSQLRKELDSTNAESKEQASEEDESKSQEDEVEVESSYSEESIEEIKVPATKKGRPRKGPKCKSYQKNSSSFNAEEYILKYLLGDADFSGNRGRPRLFKSNDYDDLISIVKENTVEEIKDMLVKHLEKIKSDERYRGDAILTSLCRTLRKVSLKLLHYYGSKTMFKSKQNDSCLISYIETFKKCFMVVFPQCEKEDLLELFLNFITLRYPKRRVKIIINSLSKSLITEKDQKKYLNFLKSSKTTSKKTSKKTSRNTSRNTSKKEYKNVYQQNSAFKIIVNGVQTLIHEEQGISQEVKEIFAKVISKIAS